MADEQSSYDGEEGEVPESADYAADSTTPADGAVGEVTDSASADLTTPVANDAGNDDGGDYDDDEPIPDYVVNLSVNEQPDLVNAAITDTMGNVIGTQTNLYGVTTALYDELNGNSTAITGSKGLWGWSTLKLILVGLLALCILALILGILFFIFGKKFKKNKRTTTTGPTTATKAVVTKGVSPDPKYQPVPNV